jgi:hypothetical protein
MPSLTDSKGKMSSDVAKFPQLMKELESKTDEVLNQLKPILSKYVTRTFCDRRLFGVAFFVNHTLSYRVSAGEIKTSKGISFLEAKYHILLQYISNLAFIIQLKLSGKQVEGHPVVQSLIELRVILEKMKPVEQKLKYQIDKVVRTALVGQQDNEMANGRSAGMHRQSLSPVVV